VTSILLSIIIVNWNTRDLLEQCLLSIHENVQTFKRANVQTFVVDNGSTDGSPARVRDRFPWVCLIENSENLGFARANNQGVRASTGRYVLLLNSDTEAQPGAFETMVDFMQAHPHAGACGPRLLNSDGSLQPSCHPTLTPWREFWRLCFLEAMRRVATYDMAAWPTDAPREVEVIKGACLMLRRDALDEVGLLDERYFMYTEEMDLCYRLLQAGWELWWVPWADVTHYGEASSKQMAEEMYVQLYRSKAQFHHKFGGDDEAGHFRRLLGLAYAPRWAATAFGGLVVPSLASRARVFRRLLREVVGL